MKRRETIRAIRDHVGHIVNQHKEGLLRLKEYAAHTVIRAYLARAVYFF